MKIMTRSSNKLMLNKESSASSKHVKEKQKIIMFFVIYIIAKKKHIFLGILIIQAIIRKTEKNHLEIFI